MPPITREPLLLLARLQRLPTTRYTWAFVSLLGGGFIIEAFDMGSLSVILPILKPLMQLSPVQVGLLVASSVIGLTIGNDSRRFSSRSLRTQPRTDWWHAVVRWSDARLGTGARLQDPAAVAGLLRPRNGASFYRALCACLGDGIVSYSCRLCRRPGSGAWDRL